MKGRISVSGSLQHAAIDYDKCSGVGEKFITFKFFLNNIEMFTDYGTREVYLAICNYTNAPCRDPSGWQNILQDMDDNIRRLCFLEYLSTDLDVTEKRNMKIDPELRIMPFQIIWEWVIRELNITVNPPREPHGYDEHIEKFTFDFINKLKLLSNNVRLQGAIMIGRNNLGTPQVDKQFQRFSTCRTLN